MPWKRSVSQNYTFLDHECITIIFREEHHSFLSVGFFQIPFIQLDEVGFNERFQRILFLAYVPRVPFTKYENEWINESLRCFLLQTIRWFLIGRSIRFDLRFILFHWHTLFKFRAYSCAILSRIYEFVLSEYTVFPSANESFWISL